MALSNGAIRIIRIGSIKRNKKRYLQKTKQKSGVHDTSENKESRDKKQNY